MISLRASVFLLSAMCTSLVNAHARLGTMIPGYGRLQNFDALANRSPLNTFLDEGDMQHVAFCKNLQNGGGKATTLNPGPNKFDLDLNMAPHGGGSFQVSLSYDQGKTFKVIKSFIAGFPRNGGGNNIVNNQTYTFTIPADAQSGPAIFSWSWSNLVGNREWYHDCSPINITGTGTNNLSSYPDMFVANVKTLTSCTNAENINVEYPDPGQDVERGEGTTGAPQGSCGKVTGSGAPASSSNSTGTANVGATPSSAPSAGSSSSGAGTYTVVQGDTCIAIGQAQGVDYHQIMANNPSINADCTNLQIGQVVTLRRRSRIMRSFQ